MRLIRTRQATASTSPSAGSRGATIKSMKGPSIVFKDEAERPSEQSRDDRLPRERTIDVVKRPHNLEDYSLASPEVLSAEEENAIFAGFDDSPPQFHRFRARNRTALDTHEPSYDESLFWKPESPKPRDISMRHPYEHKALRGAPLRGTSARQ